MESIFRSVKRSQINTPEAVNAGMRIKNLSTDFNRMGVAYIANIETAVATTIFGDYSCGPDSFRVYSTIGDATVGCVFDEADVLP